MIDEFLNAAVAGEQGKARKLLAELPSDARENIFVAVMTGWADCVASILARDSSTATRPGGPKNWPPLLYLSFSRFHHEGAEQAAGLIRVARALLARGADPNTNYPIEPGSEVKLPALWAAACESNHPALARVLLEAGANPNDGETIYHATERNYREALNTLLEFGVNLNGPIQPWNNTPLYFVLGHKPYTAAGPSAFAGIQWLLEHGANPNVPSYDHQSRPIHLAAINGWSAAMFDLLLQHGADINIRRADGKTAFALASRHGHLPAVEWLRAHGADTTLTTADEFFAACGRDDEAAVKAILAETPDFARGLPDLEKRLIVLAASDDRAEAVHLMLSAGIPADTRNECGQTALHFASWYGNVATVKVLLAARAPLDIRDSSYNATPLGWACHGSTNCHNPGGNHVAIVKALVAAGAEKGELRGSNAVNAALRGAPGSG